MFGNSRIQKQPRIDLTKDKMSQFNNAMNPVEHLTDLFMQAMVGNENEPKPKICDFDSVFKEYIQFVKRFEKCLQLHNNFNVKFNVNFNVKDKIKESLRLTLHLMSKHIIKLYGMKTAEFEGKQIKMEAVVADVSVAEPVSDDRQTKANALSSTTELRNVNVPNDVVSVFLELAKSNTDMLIETCGLLTGRLYGGELFITHLIIPQQKGTRNTCCATHEEQLLEVQEQLQVMTLGWIHTHPTQGAFMSSVDWHTQYSYQRMLPEAFSIVCSVKTNTTLVAMLTPQPGLEMIGNCTKTKFHVHPMESQLYMKPEHIKMTPLPEIEVIDLRKSKA